jgi:hypothetical protein
MYSSKPGNFIRKKLFLTLPEKLIPFMKFRTEITLPAAEFQLAHPAKVMLMGSCFIENISSRIRQSGFLTEVNPSGILYNPASIASCLSSLLDGRLYTEKNLFQHQGVYHSFAHHSRFSGINAEQALEQINCRLNQASAFLKEANLLILTFGTATGYRLLSSGEVVSNCHKLPSVFFQEERLTVQAITQLWNNLIGRLQAFCPGLRILFTVSPIRHWKNGAHENQLNKATLLLAINELVNANECCHYFPSYEIMMDDLRDYRFYVADMIHPNQQAIDYIWEKFAQLYFDPKTREIIKEWENIQQALNHRPFNPETKEYKEFIEKTGNRKDVFLRTNLSFRP